jgi:hypothetical protein
METQCVYRPMKMRIRSALIVALVTGALAAAMSWGQHQPVPGAVLMEMASK